MFKWLSHLVCLFLFSLSSPLLAVEQAEEKINTEEEFTEVLNELYDKTAFWMTHNNAELQINGLWQAKKPNANAGQKSPTGKNIWTVNINGGLARDANVTKDHFMLVYCHELGHHLAGFPFFKDTKIAGMSVEGEADYYSSFCLKEIWKTELSKNKEAKKFVTEENKNRCNSSYSSQRERHLCYRVMNAIRSQERWYLHYDTENPGKFDGEVGEDVKETSVRHPNHACRIKTMEAANFCKVEKSPYFIPGKNKKYSADSREAELSAAEHSCVNDTESRPRCWFAPKVDILAGVTDVRLYEIKGDMNNIPAPGETFELMTEVTNHSHRELSQDTSVGLVDLVQKYRVKKKDFFRLSGLQPKAKKVLPKITLTISETAKCGESIDLTYNFQNKSSSESQTKSISLGKIEKNPLAFEGVKAIKIPDSNSFGQYATQSVRVKDMGSKFDKAFVKVNIRHSNRADLLAFLISPSGKRYRVFQKRELISTAAEHVFHINIQETKVDGLWKIEIRDVIPTNKGRLKSWELRFGNSVCS